MLDRGLNAAVSIALAAALTMIVGGARAAADEAKYPNWKGQWERVSPRLEGQNIRFDPNKPWGLGQQAPLTPEYQKVLEKSMADEAQGGLGNYPTARCFPGGMPHLMSLPHQEYIITPETTYIIAGTQGDIRRVFTDGRDWPTDLDPTYEGYSIGRWIDTHGDGRYDTLAVETRGPFAGPRAYDASGLPLAFDNRSIFREWFHLDEADANLLHDEITVIDHALTRPWSVDKTFRRNSNPRPVWPRTSCVEGNRQIVLGKENYFLSDEGLLMPVKKDQPPPDLKYFKPTRQ